MPSHSGTPSEHPSETGTDWSQESLLPYYLKKGYVTRNDPELPAVEPETPEQEAEREKEPDMAAHMTLLERYEQETT